MTRNKKSIFVAIGAFEPIASVNAVGEVVARSDRGPSLSNTGLSGFSLIELTTESVLKALRRYTYWKVGS